MIYPESYISCSLTNVFHNASEMLFLPKNFILAWDSIFVFSWNVCIQLWTSFLGYPNSSYFEKRVYIKVFHATIMQFQLQCKTLGAGKHEHVHTDFHDFLN